MLWKGPITPGVVVSVTKCSVVSVSISLYVVVMTSENALVSAERLNKNNSISESSAGAVLNVAVVDTESLLDRVTVVFTPFTRV